MYDAAMNRRPKTARGRGTGDNPPNRFDKRVVHFEPGPDASPSRPKTQFIPDHARSIIATNQSPDIHFDASVNPYRGCEHGCIYCYARPSHEFLGYSAGLDFETKILVKKDAPDLLRRELTSTRWAPQVIAISGVTDPYQPVERKMGPNNGTLSGFSTAAFRRPPGPQLELF